MQFTIDDLSVGTAIADDLLRHRLIACAQRVGPVHSAYWWQGELAESDEWLFLCKTTETDLQAVMDNVVDQHTYETPEVVAVPIEHGSEDYIRWVATTTAPARR